MFRAGFSRRLLAALAVIAVLGLGTLGLHHFYTDVMGNDDAGHNCLTCRVLGSSVALLAVTVTGVAAHPISRAMSFPSLGVEHAGYVVRLGSRGPPTVRTLFVAF